MDRRFPPTQKKLKRARKDGDVAKAPEITGTLVVVAGLFAFGITLEKMQQMLESAHNFGKYNDHALVFLHLEQMVHNAAIILCVILAGLFTVSAAVEMLQTGWIITFSLFKVERINLSAGFRRLFGFPGEKESFSFFRTPIWELFKISTFILLASAPFFYLLTAMLKTEPNLESILVTMAGVLISPVIIIIMLSILILLIQCLDRKRRLLMTLEELKQELRESESNGEIKRKRQELFEELSRFDSRRAQLIVTGGGVR